MEIHQHDIFLPGGESVNIYFLGDIHEGNCNHAEKEFKEAVRIIDQDPRALWVGMGDYIEAITTTDKRFDPMSVAAHYKIKDLKDLPYAQLENLYRKLKPIDSKCIALLIGNHEEMYVKYNHSDVYKRFHDMFESKPKKIGYVGFLKLNLTRRQKHDKTDRAIVIGLNHGDGGGGFREGYPLNKLHDAFRWMDADICVMGHIHQLVHDTKKVIGVAHNNTIQRRRKHWGVSGCFLYTYVEGNKNYFEHKGRSEGDIGMLKATITQQAHEFSTTLTDIQLG